MSDNITVTVSDDGERSEVHDIGTVIGNSRSITVEYQHLTRDADHWHTVYATSGGTDLLELDALSAIRLGALLVDAGLIVLDAEAVKR